MAAPAATAEPITKNQTKLTTGRRAARELALRVLYSVDVGHQPIEEALQETIDANALDEKAAEFCRLLVWGTAKSKREIDATIDRIAVGFPTERQTAVDRNILRLAASEILIHVSDAPPGAVVNEAVELAKKYSTGESGKFVNGVLGTLVREVEEAAANKPTENEPESEPTDA